MHRQTTAPAGCSSLAARKRRNRALQVTIVVTIVTTFATACSDAVELDDPAAATLTRADLPAGEWIEVRSGEVAPAELRTTRVGIGNGSTTCAGGAVDIPVPARGAGAVFRSESPARLVAHIIAVMDSVEDATNALSTVEMAFDCESIEDAEGRTYTIEQVVMDGLDRPHVAAVARVSEQDLRVENGGVTFEVTAGDAGIVAWREGHVVVLVVLNSALAGLDVEALEHLVARAHDRFEEAN